MGLFSKKSKTKKASSPSTTKGAKNPSTPKTSATPATPPTYGTLSSAPSTQSKKIRTRITLTPNPHSQPEPENDKKDVNDGQGLSAAALQVLDDLQASEGAKINGIAQGESPQEEKKEEIEDVADVADVADAAPVSADETEKPAEQQEEETITRKLLDTFNLGNGCDFLPEQLQAMIPEEWLETFGQTPGKKKQMPTVSYFNETFAKEFREELQKSGFALVNHQPASENNGDWLGRSVTLQFRAGVCNALDLAQPSIQWSTMGGGKQPQILTRSIEIMDIHSITVSTSKDVKGKMNANDDEDVQCFFTLTSKSGNVHVFEALNRDECHRLVIGIKNINGRYSKLMVAGDEDVLPEYFDVEKNPEELQLVPEQAMMILSHAFLNL